MLPFFFLHSSGQTRPDQTIHTHIYIYIYEICQMQFNTIVNYKMTVFCCCTVDCMVFCTILLRIAWLYKYIFKCIRMYNPLPVYGAMLCTSKIEIKLLNSLFRCKLPHLNHFVNGLWHMNWTVWLVFVLCAHILPDYFFFAICMYAFGWRCHTMPCIYMFMGTYIVHHTSIFHIYLHVERA